MTTAQEGVTTLIMPETKKKVFTDQAIRTVDQFCGTPLLNIWKM